METEPIWLTDEAVRALQNRTIDRQGGMHGVRDEGLLASALGRPLNRHAYDAGADLADLAAAYATGLAMNHPFIDGNKRIAFITATLFLALNGRTLAVPEDEATATMLALASGHLDEKGLAAWIRQHTI